MLFRSLSQLSLGSILSDLIFLVELCVIVEVIFSWVFAFGGRIPLYNPVVRFIRRVADGVTHPLKRYVPGLVIARYGMDLSPMVAVLLLEFLRDFVYGLLG